MSPPRSRSHAPSPPPDHRPPLDPFVWKACAGNDVNIPAVGSRVYYFPQGHVEQSSTAPDFSTVAITKSCALCRVVSIRYLADQETDEVFVRIGLDPRPALLSDPIAMDVDSGGQAASAFAKVLTPSDANNGGGFSVPRFCADSVFPALDFESDTPLQTLRMTDLLGNKWNFRHIYRGMPRRHLLTTGWSKFVNAKKLVAGDSVVFIKSSGGEVFVGIRRRSCGGGGSGIGNCRNGEGRAFVRNGRGRVSAEAVVKAVREAEAMERVFEVEYYPRNRAAEFVVAEEKVASAMAVGWTAGMKVKLGVETDDGCRTTWHIGEVEKLDMAGEGQWAVSPWRMLKV